MNPYQAKVKEFHERFSVNVAKTPGFTDASELRAKLIEEEAKETCDAIRAGDFLETIDGLCDLAYVLFGTALSFGIDLDPFFRIVHNANMAKVNGSTRDDGKILKPIGWRPPNHAAILKLLYGIEYDEKVDPSK